ncbi:hypothetical protein PSN45_004947 [Yamadazyma tenuis]|uniref:Ribosomal protein L1 n=1 Tax=Candida tenuis (strain ATCC 10573 / BCRC 21748 / CBS 615 / JCM 9827 / NBRC 10315 / NRRL Y-1498 / VKM Y-70) TaxID=590646 RepID=G3B289_CANTC|nr:ribosomal protein L1 [Yamadazyma tenuis ATCC 10573]EGV64619.1 ribosomal protein L1 [Yamadazyma tenuis ATCC 10573]WEJ97396.1 hypothetical protein PSN45_004947 [Yamadazyma tenuis]
MFNFLKSFGQGTVRSLSTSSILRAPRADPKKQLKKTIKDKRRNKQNPALHPLYMDIPKALRYLRSAEIGEQASKSTISLLITVIPERGSKPLSGLLKLPNPVSSSKILVFSNDPIQMNVDTSSFLMGGTELVGQIADGKVDVSGFTHSYATLDVLPELKSIQRILGPKNLMCMPRKGNVADATELPTLIESNMGTMPFKQTDRHLSFPIARCDFSDKKVLENITEASKTIHSLQPPGTKKPNLIGQTVISSTKGPGIVINFNN